MKKTIKYVPLDEDDDRSGQFGMQFAILKKEIENAKFE